MWEARHDPRRLERVAWINAATEVLDAVAAAAPLATGRTKPQAAAGAIGASLAVSAGFAGLALRASSPEAALDLLAAWVPPALTRWMEPREA